MYKVVYSVYSDGRVGKPRMYTMEKATVRKAVENKPDRVIHRCVFDNMAEALLLFQKLEKQSKV